MGLFSKIAKKKLKKKPKSLVSRFPKKRKSGGLFGSAIRKILEERQQIQPISIGNIIENELPRGGGFLKRIARRNIPNFIAREIDQDSISPLQNSIEKLRNSEKPQLIERIEVKPVEFDPITSIGKSKEDRLQFLKDRGIEIPPNFLTTLPPPRNPGSYDSIGMPLLDRRNMPEGVRGGRRRRFNQGGFAQASANPQQQMMQPTQDMGALDVFGNVGGSPQQAGAATMAITYGPGGQMYTDGSRQTPYNPPLDASGNVSGSGQAQGDMMLRDLQRAQPKLQDMRARPPQRGIGSFQNPFGGFMGGGRGQFMRPQPPMYGGGFGMQPPMFGGGMNYGMPPMFGGGMYGGGFGMQPPMYGGGFGMMRPVYGGGFGSPFSPGFGGGIGGMFPGMGGGYGMRPPSYGGIGGGYNRPMPQPIRPMPQPMPIDRPRPMPQPIPIDRPRPIKRPMPMPIMETKGPSNLMRQRGRPVPLAQRQMAYPF